MREYGCFGCKPIATNRNTFVMLDSKAFDDGVFLLPIESGYNGQFALDYYGSPLIVDNSLHNGIIRFVK